MTIAGIDMQVQNAQGSSSNDQVKRGMVLPFQPLSLAFNHVNYYVDMPVVSHFFLFLALILNPSYIYRQRS